MLALSDGTMTDRESSLISQYIGKVTEYCEKKGFPIDKSQLINPQKYVTSEENHSLDKYLIKKQTKSRTPFEGSQIGKPYVTTGLSEYDNDKKSNSLKEQTDKQNNSLDTLVGLESVKKQINEIKNYSKRI